MCEFGYLPQLDAADSFLCIMHMRIPSKELACRVQQASLFVLFLYSKRYALLLLYNHAAASVCAVFSLSRVPLYCNARVTRYTKPNPKW
jgi:hypothetical protein